MVDFPTGYLTNCQDVCKIKVLALVSTGLKPGLVTVNLESWHLTCSAPPTANGEALRQKAYARGVPILSAPIPPNVSESIHSGCGTPSRSRPSIQLRAFSDSVTFQPIPAEQAADCTTLNLPCSRLSASLAGQQDAGMVLRAFRQMMLSVRNHSPQRTAVFLFS